MYASFFPKTLFAMDGLILSVQAIYREVNVKYPLRVAFFYFYANQE